MGSWDCYCAICGGPFHRSTIAEEPRSSRFLRRHGLSQKASSNQEQSHRSAEDDHGDATNGSDDSKVTDTASIEEETEEDWEEDGSFDPDVITSRMMGWMDDLHVLGQNTDDDTGATVGFVSGVGEYIDSAMVKVEAGDDPNFDPEAELICYDGCFPFHWCCFELLGTVLERKAGIDGLDKKRLYRTMMRAHPMFSSRLGRLNYGDPGPECEQWWSTEAGKEFIVVHPTASLKRTTALIRDKCMKGFQVVVEPADRLRRANADIFRKLPLELLSKICNQLTPRSVFDLAIASPTVDAFVGNKPFWKLYIATQTPWNFELLSLLGVTADSGENESETTLQKVDYKSLFLWVDQQSTPRLWMRGRPFMSLANRRRIWHVCEQLDTVYSGRRDRFELTSEERRRMNVRRERLGIPLV